MVVRWVTERQVRQVFAAVSRSDWDRVCADLASDVRHTFPGEGAVGGDRVGPAAVRRWLQRLGRLFPGHRFDVHQVAVQGPPWHLQVAVRWTASLEPAVGGAYVNQGTHWLEIRWGRVVAFHAFLDTELIARACRTMFEAGIAEAGAPPLA